LRRILFDDEHDSFRESFRRYIEGEVLPHYDDWERAGIVPREAYRDAGRHGFLGMAVPEEYGGPGADDFRFNVVIDEETQLMGVGSYGLGMSVHTDICLPYFLSYCNDAQRQRWLPGLASGELIAAIAMTEPGTGSDLASIATRARPDNGGYVVSGAKTFITNGINADLVITAARTGADAGHQGLSLLVVERGMEGFEHGRNLEKIGQHGQDTAELFFNDVRVPAENLLGEEGSGFLYLVSNLAQERLAIAVAAVAAAQAALDWTLAYVMDRRAFGQPVGTFQGPRFALADCRTEIELGQAFVDRCVVALAAGELTPEEAAMAKLWCTEMQGRVIDRCLQLHGGYGYMLEYPIARAYADARVSRIYGGSNEIMREIVGRSMGLRD
jgi:alkylation response protein AidB-like acyl-CoA dehydrogenase